MKDHRRNRMNQIYVSSDHELDHRVEWKRFGNFRKIWHTASAEMLNLNKM